MAIQGNQQTVKRMRIKMTNFQPQKKFQNFLKFVVFRFSLYLRSVLWNKPFGRLDNQKARPFFITVNPELTTTCLQRSRYCCPILNFYNINDLWTTTTCQQRTTIFGSQRWSLYKGLTVYFLFLKCSSFLEFIIV